MPSSSLDPLEERLRTQRDAIKKREIAETLLHEMNKAGDALLGVRRQLIKRIVEFDDFSSCYPDDQLAATGFVTRARELVRTKDERVRATQRRSSPFDRAAFGAPQAAPMPRAPAPAEVAQLSRELCNLIDCDDRRSVASDFERWLTKVFRVYGIRTAGPFRRVAEGSGVPIEQVDGAIEMDGKHFLVEAKFTRAKTDVDDLSRCINRVLLRSGAHGLCVSLAGFTEAAYELAEDFLSQRVMLLLDVAELALLLERGFDLKDLLQKKLDLAILTKDVRWRLDASVACLRSERMLA